MLAQPRAFALPAPDADVDVIALREHPAVPARNVGQLEAEQAAILVLGTTPYGTFASSATPCSRPSSSPRRGGDAVRPVGEQARALRRPASRRPAPGRRRRRARGRVTLTPSRKSVPARDGLLDEVGVEPLALGHEDERLVHVPLDPTGEVEPEPDSRRAVFDHRVDRERQLADGAHREPATARFVARERGLVGQQDARAFGREAIRSRRSCRPRADNEDVEALHDHEATMADPPGGVPEWPKGTGCKPVGSAFRGSNPLSPISLRAFSVQRNVRAAGGRHGPFPPDCVLRASSTQEAAVCTSAG